MSQASLETTAATNAPKASLLERWSDKLNPILVREVQQFLKGRVFLVTVLLVLAAIVLSGVYCISLLKTEGTVSTLGIRMFSVYARCLAFCALLAIPLHVFNSTRREVSGQTIELLLLSNLTPYRIVWGKLAASLVLFFLYVALFAPAMALTFLLRGVEVPLIGLTLLGLVLGCVSLSIGGILAGTFCRWRWVEIFLTGSFVIGLFMVTSSVAGSGGVVLIREVTRALRQAEFWNGFAVVLAVMVATNAIYVMLAASTLTHPYENRSTPFRVYVLLAWILTNVVVLLAVPDARRQSELFLLLALGILAGACLFFFFFVTEEEKLSPRMYAHIPKSRVWAWLSIALQPGGGRGLWFVVLSTALIFGSSVGLYKILTPLPLPSSPASGMMLTIRGSIFSDWKYLALLSVLYVLLYTGMAAGIRRFFGPGGRNNWWARLVAMVVMLLGMLLSLMGLLFKITAWNQFTWLDLLNPFVVYSAFLDHLMKFDPNNSHRHAMWLASQGKHILLGLAGLTAVIWAVHIPFLLRSIREIMAASAARRRRAA